MELLAVSSRILELLAVIFNFGLLEYRSFDWLLWIDNLSDMMYTYFLIKSMFLMVADCSIPILLFISDACKLIP